MSISRTRRTVLFSAGGLAGLSTVVPTVTRGGATSETATITGRVVYADGTPATDDEITLSSRDDWEKVRTDYEGYFTADVNPGTEYRLGYYQKEGNATEHDGAPFIYGLGEFETTTGETDLGDLTLPVPHLVTLRIRDDQGEPLYAAEPTLRHDGWGSGWSLYNIIEDGQMAVRGADTPGVEMHGDVRVEFFGRDFTRTISVTGPVEVNITADLDREEILSFDVATGDGAESGDTADEGDTDGQAGTPADDGEDDTESTAAESSTAEQENETDTDVGASEEEDAAATRGFFSNGTEDSVDTLADPFYLTIGGFVLSVVGILAQLLRGR